MDTTLDEHRLAYALRHVDELEHRAAHPERVELALWIAHGARHDHLFQRLPERTIADVRRLVNVLRDHDPAPDDGDGHVVNDADLALLSAPADEYRLYVGQLCVEQHSRLEELNHLLGRDSLYRTPEMRAGREARAQLNLARERAALTERLVGHDPADLG